MEPAYISALFGLGGAAVGGLASFLTSWSSLRSQFRTKVLEAQQARRIDLFDGFIDEASRLYGDALTHERSDVGEMIKLYALVARMQLIASSEVVHAARGVMEQIGDAYIAPNLDLHDLRERARDRELDVLAEFGEACRKDLAATGAMRF